MKRSLSPNIRNWLLPLVASCWLGLAAASGQSQGETSAVGATSIGSSVAKIAGAAAPRPPVKTSGSALTVFAPGVFPAGLSNEGDVLLSTADGLQRWKAGQSALLQIPETGDLTITGMNRNGAILGYSSRKANPGFSCLSTQKGWYWAPGQPAATEINNPFTYSGYDECAGKNTDVRQFSPRVLDPANRIWADIPYLADPGNNSAFQGLHRWDAPGVSPVQVGYHGPLPAGPYIELADVNATGVMIGLRIRDGVALAEYFVGDQAVDFYPLAINDAGQVLGYDGASTIFRNTGTNIFLEGLYPDLLNARGDVAGRFFGLPVLLPNNVVLGGSTDYTQYSLQNLLPAGWTPLQITGLNDAGAVTGFGFYADPANPNEPAQVLGFLLVPAMLRVDFDRDGVINPADSADNPDLELVRNKMPWFFWINDDNDADETDGNDIPGGGNNGEDGQANGTRDLVDFFPVHLDIAGLLKAYPASDPANIYKLAQAGGAANFMTTDLKPATAGHYHSDAGIALSLGNKPVTQITAAGVNLDRTFLDKILSQSEGGIILVEARKATDKPLRLEVWRNNAKVASVELPLSFAGVETMFRHKNLVAAVNMKPETGDRDTAPNWPDELNNNQAFVFVHGYNVNQREARGWQAEFFKRLWWSGSRAQFWGVTWYGSDSQIGTDDNAFTPNYHLNVTHAFGSSKAMKQLLTEIDAHADIHQANVAAHSLGNMVVSSAISDHEAPATRYFLLNAAVATEAYDAAETTNPLAITNMAHTTWTRAYSQDYPSKLWASHWYERFPTTGDKRRELTWRDRFSRRGNTAYYDLFSTGDHVLALDTETTPTLVGVLAAELKHYFQNILSVQAGQPSGYRTWAYQEKLKGRTTTGKVLGSNYGGWGFNNLYLKKAPGGAGGKGPVVAPVELKPSEAIALLSEFTDEALREEPFFRPGGFWTKVGTWTHDTGKPVFNEERLRLLYNPSTGSDFAKRHRDTLLARMIPALSLVTGQDAVEAFTPATSESQSFDINEASFRGKTATPPWPTTRNNANWRHSDLRVVAYPYVKNLYVKLVELGSLDQSTQ